MASLMASETNKEKDAAKLKAAAFVSVYKVKVGITVYRPA